MAKVITVGNQKGGVGKTTTAATLAYFLSKTHRVLAIDFDMQANLTQMLNGRPDDGLGVMDALASGIKPGDNMKKIDLQAPHNLHLISASDDLALFNATTPDDYLAIKRMIAPVMDEFDIIIIDTPPSLGSHLLTALMASDYAILMTMTHPFAVDAAVRFTRRLNEIQRYNPNLQMLGVVIAIFEQTTKNRNAESQIRKAFGNLVFDTTILKRAAVTRMSVEGISERTASDREALERYQKLSEEVINRV